MRVEVIAAWGGQDFNVYDLHITEPGTRNRWRERIRDHGNGWDRQTASAALDMLESVYGFTRRNVRFGTTRA